MNQLPEFKASKLSGEAVETMIRTISDLAGVFEDDAAFRQIDPGSVVYSVDSYMPVAPGTEGGLFFGITHLMPGQVGREFFMTKGHFHEKRDRAEFYWGIAGSGLLVFMSAAGKAWTEEVRPGSLHYVPGDTAHRLVNTGDAVLDVGACWPADAGHDYGSITESGFSIRVMAGESGPEIVHQ